MTTKTIKIIKVNSCTECPYYGKCSAWEKLTKKQRILLTISDSVQNEYILKDCKLEDN